MGRLVFVITPISHDEEKCRLFIYTLIVRLILQPPRLVSVKSLSYVGVNRLVTYIKCSQGSICTYSTVFLYYNKHHSI